MENDQSKNGLHCSQEGFYTNEIVSKQKHQEFKPNDIVRIVHLPDYISDSKISVGDIGILSNSNNINQLDYQLLFNGIHEFTKKGQFWSDNSGRDNCICFELITDEIPEVPIKDAIRMSNITFEVTP